MKETKTVSPWYTYFNKVREVFKNDPEIKMTLDELQLVLTIDVDNPIKAMAIRYILPETKTFDKTTVTIKVNVAAHFGGDKYLPKIVHEALKGNPIYEYMYEYNNPAEITNPMCWVVTQHDAVQYPESNGNDVWGDTTILSSDLVREIFGDKFDHIFFCTKNPIRKIPDGAIINEKESNS